MSQAPQVTSGSPPPRWGHPRVPVAAGSWHSARAAPGLRQAPAAVPFHVSWQGRERSRWRHRHTASRHASVPPPAPRTPKTPHPGVTKGRGGSRRLLVLGSSLLGRPQGTNPANAAPSPAGHLSWRRLLVLRCAPRSRFGAILGLLLPLLASPHGMAAPLARCAPTHAGLCMGSPWPLQQCHPHRIWEPGPKTAPGVGFSTPSPMRCPSLHSGAAAHI